MQWTKCMSHGIVKAADWINKNPQYRLKKFACVEPRRIPNILGRNQA